MFVCDELMGVGVGGWGVVGRMRSSGQTSSKLVKRIRDTMKVPIAFLKISDVRRSGRILS